MEADFSGYATKAGIKCTDGRTITPEAFKHQDKQKVPLVWQHSHDVPENVLGHAIFEARPDGLYAYGFFNDTVAGANAKRLVEHGDITALSIYANNLVEQTKNVLHGFVREVSLVLSGANPGALIDYVRIAHADGDVETLADEAIIYTGLPLEHADSTRTFQDIYDGLSEEEKELVHFMVGKALQSEAAHSDDTDGGVVGDKQETEPGKESGEGTENHEKGGEVKHNVFETDKTEGGPTKPVLTHSQIQKIFTDAPKHGSLKASVLAHAVEYGIENIEMLFPDAKAIDSLPELIARRMEWVNVVIGGARKTPFSRIKSLSADITHEEARAKGYVTGTLKKDEFFALAKRETTPKTIYKKQKLDRDDILDITDIDVVGWLKGEMRLMLEEEVARAVLLGDGREPDDEDKIDETKIRPIAHDDDFYAHKVVIPPSTTHEATMEAIIRSRTYYRGSGNPTMFCAEGFLTDLLLVRDKMGRRQNRTEAELAAELRVSRIVTVPIMEDHVTDDGQLLAILVNMNDYTIGADRGGQTTMFDDFDIDYNQYKYLIETRMSGALTKHKTAIVVSRAAGTLVSPNVPTFNVATGVTTIPSQTGVVYKNKETGTTLTAGAQTALDPGADWEVVAVPANGYYFPHNTDADWIFRRNPA